MSAVVNACCNHTHTHASTLVIDLLTKTTAISHYDGYDIGNQSGVRTQHVIFWQPNKQAHRLHCSHAMRNNAQRVSVGLLLL